eukprot:3409871-Rhodomonas_salina.4
MPVDSGVGRNAQAQAIQPLSKLQVASESPGSRCGAQDRERPGRVEPQRPATWRKAWKPSRAWRWAASPTFSLKLPLGSCRSLAGYVGLVRSEIGACGSSQKSESQIAPWHACRAVKRCPSQALTWQPQSREGARAGEETTPMDQRVEDLEAKVGAAPRSEWGSRIWGSLVDSEPGKEAGS